MTKITYSSSKPEPQIGDLLAIKTGGLFARVIRFGQWIKWRKLDNGRAWHFNHAAVYIGSGVIIEARPEGVRSKPLSEYADKDWEVVPLKINSTNAQEERKAALNEAFIWNMTPYGFKDIFAFFLITVGIDSKWAKKIARDSKTVVCSQLAALAAQAAGDNRFGDPMLALPVTIAQYAEYN